MNWIRAAATALLLWPAMAQAQDAFTERLQSRLDDRQQALGTADATAKPAILAEITALRAALADPERARANLRATIARVAEMRDLFITETDLTRVDTALAALEQGDTTAAEAEFDALRTEAEAHVARAARIMRTAGDLALARGDRVAAARAFVRAAALDPTYENLAAATTGARDAGDLATASAYGPALLGAAVRQFGKASAAHGDALASVAETLLAAGELAKAEPLLRDAITVSRGPNGARDAAYSRRLNNLALLLRATNRAPEAEALLREAVEVDRTVLGERHPDVAQRMGNLADLLAASGRAQEAGALYRQAVGVSLGTLGEAHPDTATRIGTLAAFLQAQGDLPGAGEQWALALQSTRAAFGPAHPEYALRLAQLADRLRDTGQAELAEAAYRETAEVLADMGEAAAADHGRALNNLGLFLSGADRKPEAVPVFQQALDILTAALGADDPAIATVRANLAAAGG